MTIDEKIQDFRQLEYDFEHCMCDTEDDKENLMKYQQEYEYYKQLAEWLEELKIYRLAIKQCKESSYMVNSKEFAKHMEEWVKEQLKTGEWLKTRSCLK